MFDDLYGAIEGGPAESRQFDVAQLKIALLGEAVHELRTPRTYTSQSHLMNAQFALKFTDQKFDDIAKKLFLGFAHTLNSGRQAESIDRIEEAHASFDAYGRFLRAVMNRVSRSAFYRARAADEIEAKIRQEGSKAWQPGSKDPRKSVPYSGQYAGFKQAAYVACDVRTAAQEIYDELTVLYGHVLGGCSEWHVSKFGTFSCAVIQAPRSSESVEGDAVVSDVPNKLTVDNDGGWVDFSDLQEFWNYLGSVSGPRIDRSEAVRDALNKL